MCLKIFLKFFWKILQGGAGDFSFLCYKTNDKLFECKKYYSSSQFLYLRVPQGFLWCSLGVPLEFFGVPLVLLTSSFGVLWGSFGVPLEILRSSFGVLWSSLEFLGDPWGFSEYFGDPQSFSLGVLQSSLEIFSSFSEEVLGALGLQCLEPCYLCNRFHFKPSRVQFKI